MSAKIYEYKGKHFCDVDLSMIDDAYVGDLYDLFEALQDDGETDTTEPEYCRSNDEGDCRTYYDSREECIEQEFPELVIGETEEE